MNAPPAPVGRDPAEVRLWVWLFLALCVCAAAITHQSLWIDESLTATKAFQISLPDWWIAMQADKASDLQMPVYMLYIWGFAKIFGTSEWALRAANIPWFLSGILALAAAFRGRKAFLIIALACPFAWYYLDEARPYTMQLGSSLLIFCALRMLSQPGISPPAHERRWLGIFLFGIACLSGSSLLGMIWAGAACLSLPFLFSWARLKELARSHRLIILTATVFLIALSFYYLWTIKEQARASDAGRTDARNLAFIVYELFGFSGLGPGRLDLRAGRLNAFAPFAIPLLLYGVLVGDVVIQGCRELYRTQPRRTLIALSSITALPVVFIFIAGYTAHFRVLGRHFTPLLPAVLLILGRGLDACWSQRNRLAKLLTCAFVALSLVSCLSFRLAARHMKDDYRDAARLANTALGQGRSVWWNAGSDGGTYYHVPLAENNAQKDHAVLLLNPEARTLASLPPPQIIITSKPDVFDGFGTCAEYIQQGTYVKSAVLPAFVIWERKNDRNLQ